MPFNISPYLNLILSLVRKVTLIPILHYFVLLLFLGYFWMGFKSFLTHFSCSYFVKLFPSEKFDFYCVRGELKNGMPLTCYLVPIWIILYFYFSNMWGGLHFCSLLFSDFYMITFRFYICEPRDRRKRFHFFE